MTAPSAIETDVPAIVEDYDFGLYGLEIDAGEWMHANAHVAEVEGDVVDDVVVDDVLLVEATAAVFSDRFGSKLAGFSLGMNGWRWSDISERFRDLAAEIADEATKEIAKQVAADAEEYFG